MPLLAQFSIDREDHDRDQDHSLAMTQSVAKHDKDHSHDEDHGLVVKSSTVQISIGQEDHGCGQDHSLAMTRSVVEHDKDHILAMKGSLVQMNSG